MFPHYIVSQVTKDGKHIVLWQHDHYEYELEWTGGKSQMLYDTPYEQAIEEFTKTIKEFN